MRIARTLAAILALLVGFAVSMAGPVLADNDDVLTAAQAGGGQAQGQLLHQCGQLRPRQRLPHAVGLLAQRGRVGPAGGVIEQEPGEGRQACLQCAGWSLRL